MSYYKTYESTGSGGNNGDSYFGGITDYDANKINQYFTISESGNQSRINEITGSGPLGGSAGTSESTTGGSGSNGTCYITWPVSYRRRADNTIEYVTATGALPRFGTIRFSDLAQLGTESDGSVRFSQYYRGSNFIPTAGEYSDRIVFTNSSQQRNLGAYRVSIGLLFSRGFRNSLVYTSPGQSNTFTLPKGVRYLYVQISGAGGGGGGYDNSDRGNTPGGNGGRGSTYSGLLDLQVYQGSHDSTITVRVGTGGSGGFTAFGGGGGAAATDTSNPLYGGPGGNAGTYGASGGGGSGGGASWIKFGDGVVSSTSLKVVAGGGGGGGGQARTTDNPNKNGGVFYSGGLTSSGAPALPGTAGLNFMSLGFYESRISSDDGAGFGGGGGGRGQTSAGGIGGGNQFAAPPILTLYDDSPPPPPSGGTY